MRASVVTAPWLQSTGSVVVSHGVSCSMACRIFPDQGSDAHLLHWQADSLPPSHQGSPYLLHSAKWVHTKVLSVARLSGQGTRKTSSRLRGEGGAPQTQEPCWFKLPALKSQESTNVETTNTLITYESETNSGQVCCNRSRERKTCCFQNALK